MAEGASPIMITGAHGRFRPGRRAEGFFMDEISHEGGSETTYDEEVAFEEDTGYYDPDYVFPPASTSLPDAISPWSVRKRYSVPHTCREPIGATPTGAGFLADRIDPWYPTPLEMPIAIVLETGSGVGARNEWTGLGMSKGATLVRPSTGESSSDEKEQVTHSKKLAFFVDKSKGEGFFNCLLSVSTFRSFLIANFPIARYIYTCCVQIEG